MKKLFLSVAVLLLASIVVFAADVSGTWRGTISVPNQDGTVRNAPAMVVLKQSGTEVTGWAGDNENDQNPIAKGMIVDDKLSFTVTARNGVTLTLDLTVKGDKMAGTVKASDGRQAGIQLAQIAQ